MADSHPLRSLHRKFLLSLDLDQPAPRDTEVVVSPTEAQVAVRADAREVGAAELIYPRGISEPDRSLAVRPRVLDLKGLAPLTIGNRAILREPTPHLGKAPAVADGDEHEAAGLVFRDTLPGELPLLGVIVSVAIYHCDRIVSSAVEREREGDTVGRVSRERRGWFIHPPSSASAASELSAIMYDLFHDPCYVLVRP